mgnify:CR=1 FL=1
MKSCGNLILVSLLFISFAAQAAISFRKNVDKKLNCRITYYCGDDKWGDQVADPATKRAISGITVAAHPDFSFGTKIFIPELKDHMGDGHFIVQDRGGWVTSKKAAKGKAYVFDVYVPTKREQRTHASKRPMYMEVHILRD